METLNKKLLDNIPEIGFVEERFNFIDNKTEQFTYFVNYSVPQEGRFFLLGKIHFIR